MVRSGAAAYELGCGPAHPLQAVVESMLIGILGTLVGLGLGVALLGWIIDVVSRDTYPELGLPVTLTPASFAIAAALGIVPVALAPLFGVRRLRDMDSRHAVDRRMS